MGLPVGLAAELVGQSGTCVITNSWKSKKNNNKKGKSTGWRGRVGGGAAQTLRGGKGIGPKAVGGRKRSREGQRGLRGCSGITARKKGSRASKGQFKVFLKICY